MGIKKNIDYICTECGYSSNKWLGKCPQCEQWNTLQAVDHPKSNVISHRPARLKQAIPLAKIITNDIVFHSSGFKELDRVLGGGLVPGATVLLGGEPGIGKSTLVLQVAMHLAREKKNVLYCSGEESPQQVKLRALRLGYQSKIEIDFLPSTDVETVLQEMGKKEYALIVVDSIQTARSINPASAGSIVQVRESAYQLINRSESLDGLLLLIAHVTKEGGIAGPKLLEHIVDSVLYFEGERMRDFRVVRAFKNRFGPINEIALFKMGEQGLSEVDHPSSFFLEENHSSGAVGMATSPIREGSLILVVEVQALASEILYQAPRRAADGIELNRVQLISAVLDKCTGMNMRGYDIFVKVGGGADVHENAVDLALAMALASSFLNRPLPPKVAFIAEISLAGNLRPVPLLSERISSLNTMGYTEIVIPAQQSEQVRNFSGHVFAANHLNQVVDHYLSND